MDRPLGSGPSVAARRAERFEDEKRRIIDSCFSKSDADGSLAETYITHIRVTEYSSHPMSPPPPQARRPDNEKPRVIIVAVRKSGRVRVHKSKENINGTFSIGKTWNLDDLTQIQSFTSPQNSQNIREWASDTGFLVAMGKPYFWHAQTDKEKKFFIASLIKIYGKYTGGKTPELTGFDQKELDQVLGAGRRPTTASSRHPVQDSASVQHNDSSASPHLTLTPADPSPGAHEIPRFPKSPVAAARSMLNGTISPAGSMDSVASRDLSATRWTAHNNRSQDSMANSFGPRTSSLIPRSRNGAPGLGAFSNLGGSSEQLELPPEPSALSPLAESISEAHPPLPPPHMPQEEKTPPERRRPPMDPSRPRDRDMVPPPLLSSALSRDPVPPPLRSAGRSSSPARDLGNNDGLVSTAEVPPPAALPAVAPLSIGLKQPTSDDAGSAGGTRVGSDVPTPTTPVSDSPLPSEQPSSSTTQDSRPGLGPMIKAKRSKADIAGALWKAASVATAFRPRPGGAGDRLRQAQGKASDGPDGITGVVPAPPRPLSRDHQQGPPTPTLESATVADRHSASGGAEARPVVSGGDGRSRPASAEAPLAKGSSKEEAAAVATVATAAAAEETKRRSIVTGNDVKYLQTLGVNPGLLDGRSEEFGKWLDYFGWVPGDPMRTWSIDDNKADLERELNKAQAGGWLARFYEEDERVGAIKRGIDVATAECEELDNLLTLYSVELSTLSDDIAYIEAQGQGLQVQAANQKLLKKELESLLETCAITAQDLQALHNINFDKGRDLEAAESALNTLFKAMTKMDPSLGGGLVRPEGEGGGMESEAVKGLHSNYGNMWIVMEKKKMFAQESEYFLDRLSKFMDEKFKNAVEATTSSLDGALSKKSDGRQYDVGRNLLWKYSPLMLYAREAGHKAWKKMMEAYKEKSQPLYKSQFEEVMSGWRKRARKIGAEESELLFSTQVEKQQEGMAVTARKMTLKRSQTLARALRSPLVDGNHQRAAAAAAAAAAEKAGAAAAAAAATGDLPYEVFEAALDEVLPLVEMEQNFIIDFFHATSLEQTDFADAVAVCGPEERKGGDLRRRRLMDPNRELARLVTVLMEAIFASLPGELEAMMEWAIKQDPLQGIGLLSVLEKKLSEIAQSNQDYVNGLLYKLHSRLEGRFSKFFDEQIRAIEETKVRIKKRKGVIAFVRVFPAFVSAVENMFAGVEANLALRRTIDGEYERLLKSMFESLMVIAREHPAAGVASGAADPEDKEALNFHVLLIENMNYLLEETETRGRQVLESWREQAQREYHEHMELYLKAVIRRPLGKLLDQLENIEGQLEAGKAAEAIARQPSNSMAVFNKVLSGYDAKEVRKGIEALRKRIEKHFGDADEAGLGSPRGLTAKVTRECERLYGQVEARIGRLTTEVYGGEVLFEWPRAEVKAAFR